MTISNQIVISGQSVSKIEYKNQPVVSFRMIDDLHQRPEGTARKSFYRHKHRLIENEDYFEVSFEELKNSQMSISCTSETSKQHNKVILLTQTGYMMLVKPFTDDLSWQIQRQLVRGYFLNLEKYQQFLSWHENPYTYLSDMSKASGKLPDLAVQMCAYHIEFDSKNYYILSDYSDREIVIPIKVFPQKTKLVKLFFEKTRTVLKLPTKFSKFADMLNTFHAMAEERLG